MAIKGTIESATCLSTYIYYYGMRWEFRWTAAPSTSKAGVTIVSYGLYTVGYTADATKAYTQIKLSVTDQNGNQVESYTSTKESLSFTGVLQYSGSFEVNHDTDGSASFTVSMSTDIYEGAFRSATGTGVLDTNMPYYYVSIDTGSAFVKAIPYIDNGSEWKAASAYIDNGTSWKLCSG